MEGLRERKKKKVRDLILKVSENIFIEEGFAQATTKKIALKSGLAEGTIYNHFSSKSDILLAIYESYFFHFKDISLEAPAAKDGVLPFLLDCFDYFLQESRNLKKEWLREIFAAMYRKDKGGKSFAEKAQKVDNLLLGKLDEIILLLQEKGLINQAIDRKTFIEIIYALFMYHYSNYAISEDMSFETFFLGLKKGISFTISTLLI